MTTAGERNIALNMTNTTPNRRASGFTRGKLFALLTATAVAWLAVVMIVNVLRGVLG